MAARRAASPASARLGRAAASLAARRMSTADAPRASRDAAEALRRAAEATARIAARGFPRGRPEGVLGASRGPVFASVDGSREREGDGASVKVTTPVAEAFARSTTGGAGFARRGASSSSRKSSGSTSSSSSKATPRAVSSTSRPSSSARSNASSSSSERSSRCSSSSSSAAGGGGADARPSRDDDEIFDTEPPIPVLERRACARAEICDRSRTIAARTADRAAREFERSCFPTSFLIWIRDSIVVKSRRVGTPPVTRGGEGEQAFYGIHSLYQGYADATASTHCAVGAAITPLAKLHFLKCAATSAFGYGRVAKQVGKFSGCSIHSL